LIDDLESVGDRISSCKEKKGEKKGEKRRKEEKKKRRKERRKENSQEADIKMRRVEIVSNLLGQGYPGVLTSQVRLANEECICFLGVASCLHKRECH
jgi:hypothetical protein